MKRLWRKPTFDSGEPGGEAAHLDDGVLEGEGAGVPLFPPIPQQDGPVQPSTCTQLNTQQLLVWRIIPKQNMILRRAILNKSRSQSGSQTLQLRTGLQCLYQTIILTTHAGQLSSVAFQS